jgi:hypothetical protein
LSASTGISHTQLSEDEVNVLLGQVNRKMEQSQAALEALRMQLEKAEQELQNKIDGHRLATEEFYLHVEHCLVWLHVINKHISWQLLLSKITAPTMI